MKVFRRTRAGWEKNPALGGQPRWQRGTHHEKRPTVAKPSLGSSTRGGNRAVVANWGGGGGEKRGGIIISGRVWTQRGERRGY